MVGFTKLSGHACQRTSQLRDRTIPFPVDEVDYQDYKVLQWQKALPPALSMDLNEFKEPQQAPLEMTKASTTFLATVLHARAHQLRSLIYRPVLYSYARIAENAKHAQTAVDIAKESVQFLTLVDCATTFVRGEPLFFRDFLISALAGILLAVSSAPAEFSRQLRDEFFSVLDLLRSLSSKSPDMARVWNTIKILEAAAPRLGLTRPNAPTDQDRNSRFGRSYDHPPGILQTEGNVSATCFSPFWNPLEQEGGIASIDFRDVPFSTSVFPTQLRNELSILSNSTWPLFQNSGHSTFPENFAANAMSS